MSTPRDYCVFLGGGAHAAILIECLRSAGRDIVRAILDTNQSMWGKDVLGVPIRGGDDLLPELINEGADSFAVGVGTQGGMRLRRPLFEMGTSAKLEALTVVHPTAFVSPTAQLGPGVFLMPQTVVHTRARLGANVVIHSGGIIEHDCVLGDHVHVGPGANFAGAITVGEETHIGIGASIREGTRIGRGVIVGAGAVIVKDVPDNVIVAGVPARIMKELQPK